MIDGIMEIGVHQLLAARFFGASGWFDRNENRVDCFQKVWILYFKRPAGLLLSPQETLVWIMGLLGVAACVVPWFARGWLWFGLIITPLALQPWCQPALSSIK